MSRRGRPQSVGWAEKAADTLSRVKLPEKIKCKECKKKKAIFEFSNRQLDEARQDILNRNGNIFYASDVGVNTCSQCNSTQMAELRCYSCDTYKGLDDFARTQRRNPDQALCRECSELINGQYNPLQDNTTKPEDDENDSLGSDGGEEEEDYDDVEDLGHGSEDRIYDSAEEDGSTGGVMLRNNRTDAGTAGWVPQPRHAEAAPTLSNAVTQASAPGDTKKSNKHKSGHSSSASNTTSGGTPLPNRRKNGPPSSASNSTSGENQSFNKYKYGHPASVGVASQTTGNKFGSPAWSHSPSKARPGVDKTKPVVDSSKWARPKNPNIQPTADCFDPKKNWGQESKVNKPWLEDDELP